MYKTLYNSFNPSFEYQRQNGVWFKRAISSNEMWLKVDAKGQKIMQNAFKDKNAMFFYSNSFLVVSTIAVSVLGYFAYKNFAKKTKIK